MASRSEDFRALMRHLARESRELYGVALAAQALGAASGPLWAAWSVPVGAMLLGAWALGASRIARSARYQTQAPMPEGGLPIDILGYEAGSSKAVSDLFSARIPATREDWRRAVEWSASRAQAMARREEQEALVAMAKQSPKVAALLSGSPDPRSGAFFVTGLDADKAGRIRDLVGSALRGDKTVRTIRGELRAMNLGDFVSAGQLETARSLSEARLETVLRTNMASAQTAGEDITLAHPSVRAFVPLLQWSAVGDHRTRPTHEAMDGYIGTVEDYQRQKLGPPGSWNCRCGRIPVPIAKAIDAGWANPDGTLNRDRIDAHNGARQRLIDSGQFPDPGFVS